MVYDALSNGSGRSVARLARLLGVQEVGSSNLPAPTIVLKFTSVDAGNTSNLGNAGVLDLSPLVYTNLN